MQTEGSWRGLQHDPDVCKWKKVRDGDGSRAVRRRDQVLVYGREGRASWTGTDHVSGGTFAALSLKQSTVTAICLSNLTSSGEDGQCGRARLREQQADRAEHAKSVKRRQAARRTQFCFSGEAIDSSCSREAFFACGRALSPVGRYASFSDLAVRLQHLMAINAERSGDRQQTESHSDRKTKEARGQAASGQERMDAIDRSREEQSSTEQSRTDTERKCSLARD